jgi:hypothetical protein
MRTIRNRAEKRFVAAWLAAMLISLPVWASRLKPASLENFRRYAEQTEQRVQKEVQNANGFLYLDFLPADKKQAAYAQLSRGEVYIEAIRTLAEGKPMEDADSLIHHWVGVVFVPGVKLPAALAVIQDYNRHAELYSPDVMRSKILAHNGESFRTYVRFFKKKFMTVVLDTEHEIRYFPLDATRVHSRTWTTRVQQVENPGEKDEKLLPPGDDGGYMWHLFTWWRFQEKDGGTYIQCESVTLTRDLPPIIGPLIRPFVTSIPRESLTFTLGTTRQHLLSGRDR